MALLQWERFQQISIHPSNQPANHPSIYICAIYTCIHICKQQQALAITKQRSAACLPARLTAVITATWLSKSTRVLYSIVQIQILYAMCPMCMLKSREDEVKVNRTNINSNEKCTHAHKHTYTPPCGNSDDIIKNIATHIESLCAYSCGWYTFK